MMLFALFALMLAVAAFLVLHKGHPIAGAVADPVILYKKQLADLEAEEEAGLIDTASAKAAKLEIERRILRTAPPTHSTLGEHTGGNRFMIALVVAVTFGSAGLYFILGNPGVPASPTKQFDALDTPISAGEETFGSALSKIEDHLQEKPDDKKGWQVLARTSRAVGDYRRAAEAYEALMALEPDVVKWRADRFEMFMAAGNGQITPAANMVLDDLTRIAPEHPATTYYQGLSALQAGNHDGAKAIWTALADRSASNAPWMPQVNAMLGKLGAAPPKLSGDQLAAVQSMSAEEQTAFIESMMDRLRSRLEENPNDPAGWLMLARSELAQGNKDKATATLEQALRILPTGKTAEIEAFLDNLRGNGNP